MLAAAADAAAAAAASALPVIAAVVVSALMSRICTMPQETDQYSISIGNRRIRRTFRNVFVRHLGSPCNTIAGEESRLIL